MDNQHIPKYIVPTYSSEDNGGAVENTAPFYPTTPVRFDAPTYSSGELSVAREASREGIDGNVPVYSSEVMTKLQSEEADDDVLSAEELKKKNKLRRKRTRRYFAWAGIMMIIFTLLMSDGTMLINKLAMYFAIPNKVSEVFANGGLSAVSDFYYDEYCAVEGKYYALSGITDNIGYCVSVICYCLPFLIFAFCNKLGKTIFRKGERFSRGFFYSAFFISLGLLNIWADAYYFASERITFIDLSKIFTLFEEQSNAAFSSALGTVFYFIAICIAAPLGEEFVFRGVLLGYLRKYGDWFAILTSAALFGLMHMNFYQTPYAFLVGLVFGFITVKTGSVLCAMLLHIINNSLSTISEMASHFLPKVGEVIEMAISGLYMAAIPIAIVLIIIYSVKGRLKLQKPEIETIETSTRAKGLKFCLAVPNLLFILFCILSCVLFVIPDIPV